MMTTSRIPFAVIGVGSLGFHHARILRDLPGVRLEGVHDADPVRAEEVEKALGIRTFSDPKDLFSRVEAAVIAVPTPAHAAVALQAVEAGVHLLIEKPITSTLEEADRVLEAADARGLLVATGHVERFNGALRACEKYLDAPRFIESHRLAPFGPRGTEVAVVLDLMIHDIDLILSLVHEPVADVAGIGVPVLTSSVDIANARITFAGGAAANITASRVSMERMRKIRLFQESGYMSLDLARGEGSFLRLKPGVSLGALTEIPMALTDVVERIQLSGDGAEPLRTELEAFREAVAGRSELVVSGRDGREALQVALEIMQRTESNVLASRPA